ncbi:hypothetical protein MLD38_012220 [Melastoma candidum]|nr:hypothetical protein MLD38_012220 [Melastoma candidum]
MLCYVKRRVGTVKPFAEADVFPSSLPLHTRNPHDIYKDIRKFARAKKLKEALVILDYMDQRGIPVNVTTLSSVISACIRKKSLVEGRQVHVHVKINGLENNEFLRAKLINMYMSCGSPEDAKRIFDTGSSTTSYPYNALMRGAVIAGGRQYRDVMSTFSEMQELGIDCTEYTYSCLIKSIAGASAFQRGLKAHALLVKNGFISSSILKTCLVDMYCKCGKVKLACNVFEEAEDRDIVLWGAMISGFAHNRLFGEAIEFTRMMMDQGLSLNSVVLTAILPIVGDLQDRTLGRELHGYIMKRRFSKQLPVQTGLIDMYCKCGNMTYGRRVFYNTKERNAVTWTALMSGYISNGRLEQAVRSIIWMQQERFWPDMVTVATVLPVCSELRDLKRGKEIHAYSVKRGFLANVSVITCLMVMYSKCKVIQYTARLFESLPERNVICWTAMIDSYAESGLPYEALDVFRSMQLSWHRPDSIVFSRILNVCSQVKAVKLGKEIHGQILKKNLQDNPYISAGLIRIYASCQSMGSAVSVFESTSTKGAITWTAIIEAYGMNSLYTDAVVLFRQMTSEGFSPNEITLKTVLEICRRGGFEDEASRVADTMSAQHETYATEGSTQGFCREAAPSKF